MHEGHRQRLRERFEKEGLSHFQPHEILELLLAFAIPRRDTNPTAHRLLDRFGSLHGVFQADREELMKVEGWGLTEQAQMRVATLFYRPQQLEHMTTLKLTTDNWQLAQGRAVTASALLRNEISDEYMDELLQKLRTASMGNADIIVMQKCCAFMADFISMYDLNGGIPNELLLRQVVHQLEVFPDSYPTYTSSTLYARRHAERYKNKREDPTFFFM